MKTFTCILVIALFAGNVFSQVRRPRASKSFSVCEIEYTELGRTANWQLTLFYVLKTNEDGSVDRVRGLVESKRQNFNNEDKLLECVKSWKMTPSGKYVVSFSLGTTGVQKYMTIVDPNRDVIKLGL